MGNTENRNAWILRALFCFAFFSLVMWGSGCGSGGSSDNPTGTTGVQGDDPPVISSVKPERGHILGGLPVVINGANFTNSADTTVTFGGEMASNVFVFNPSYIYCETPAQTQSGEVDVTVSNSNGEDTLVAGFTYHENPTILWLDAEITGDQVDFTWELTNPGDQIIVYRGSESIASLSGNATTFTYTESSYGYIRFTVALYVASVRLDEKDVFIDFGRAIWDPPSMVVSGYCLYVAEAVGDPYQVLPYGNPSNFDFDAGDVTSLDLMDLYDDGLIDGGNSYFLAASSYVASYPERLFSDLTPPVTFDYEVVVEDP